MWGGNGSTGEERIKKQILDTGYSLIGYLDPTSTSSR